MKLFLSDPEVVQALAALVLLPVSSLIGYVVFKMGRES